MKVTWYGHSAFGLEAADGTLIVTDPYDPEKSGFKPFPDAADVVIKSSSNDSYHDNDHLVPKKPGAAVIDALELALEAGQVETHGMTVRAIEAMEHDAHPSGHPDQNGMYRFDVDGIAFGHLGDMGNDLSEAQMAFFEGIDVLFAHAGGYPVVSLEEVNRIVARVQPRLVIPMHFRTLCLRPQMMHFISAFVESFGEARTDFAAASTVELTPDSLPTETRALVMAYI